MRTVEEFEVAQKDHAHICDGLFELHLPHDIQMFHLHCVVAEGQCPRYREHGDNAIAQKPFSDLRAHLLRFAVARVSADEIEKADAQNADGA